MKKYVFKRIAVLAICLLGVFALSGCSKEKKPEEIVGQVVDSINNYIEQSVSDFSNSVNNEFENIKNDISVNAGVAAGELQDAASEGLENMGSEAAELGQSIKDSLTDSFDSLKESLSGASLLGGGSNDSAAAENTEDKKTEADNSESNDSSLPDSNSETAQDAVIPAEPDDSDTAIAADGIGEGSDELIADDKNNDGEATGAAAEYVEYRFRSKNLLNQHYEKHGIEMGFKSAADYQKAASDVVNNPAALHKIEQEDGDYVFYVEATNEFVIVSQDGYIRTYFLPSAGKKYYDRQ